MISTGALAKTPQVLSTTSHLTATDHWDHFLARVGWKRGEHRVEPGLYALGEPTPDSPVFVTANYTLSFDALRAALNGMDGYILVLDTQGINVWCAAGKGTFGTDEIVQRVFTTGIRNAVNHRKLILPQLGAPGVAAHEVKKRTGFKVEYGPVRAADLPEYLKTHTAAPEMRRVQFSLRDRATLIPVEFVHVILPTLIVAVILYFTGGILSSLAAVTAVLAGTVLFPILLPWLPTHNFSTKGFILGGLAALPFALTVFIRHPDWTWYRQLGQALGFLLAMPAVTAFLTLNFTGATTFTSRTGVRREMFAYIPAMAWTFAAGIVLNLVFVFVR
ncbi:MAG: carbon monoxide dehydrogenase [Anaerolineae bacterium CG_4_9_14_0_8_um_filter_58_9]|nr:MAG: carbon monoxide dehydrogenase [Anaerolineae bacterium CG_4_9_14_0_8_um_filter_58_9]